MDQVSRIDAAVSRDSFDLLCFFWKVDFYNHLPFKNRLNNLFQFICELRQVMSIPELGQFLDRVCLRQSSVHLFFHCL